MAKTLSTTTIETVKATVPALEAHGLEITQRMYARLFENEHIRALFNQSHQDGGSSQPKALAGAILAYARHIDQLEVLGAAVERIAQKHTGLQILPEHYPFVATALLGAIKDVLGDAATEDVLAAWGEAYWFLADLLIGREADIYRQQEEAPGGWRGWRNFVIADVRRESDVITSFRLEPQDGEPVLRHRPGQYLTFALAVPGQGEVRRNYSISSAPADDHYRISVKREPHGAASGWLHEEAKPGTVLKVAPPAGEFFLPEKVERPVVLLSGGVGLTPMVSMLHRLGAEAAETDVHFVHGAQNGKAHALKAEVAEIAGNCPHVKTAFFYAEPLPEERAGADFDAPGFIGLDWLAQNTPLGAADFYLCGPRPFLRTYVQGLAAAGVSPDRIHYEFFGPADDLLAA